MKGKKILIIALACLVTCTTPLATSAGQLSSYEYDLQTKKETYHQGVEVAKPIEGPDFMTDIILEDVKAENTGTTQKTGWFTKGKYRYYRMKNSKLCKEHFVKIGKYYYSFDSKGRMRTGTVKLSKEFKGFFNKRNGKYVYTSIDLKVVNNKASIIGKNGKNRYFSISKRERFENKVGRKISSKTIKKGDRIRVLFRGDINEIFPASFNKIVKIKKL